MSKIVDFLNEAKTYYLATVEEGEARVRPIGATVGHDGKIYFGTNNQKEMFKQMLKNPNIAISGMNERHWIRITGKAVVDNSADARRAMLEANPVLKNMYSIDDGIFEVFFIEDMKAILYSFTSEPIELVN